MMISCAWDVIGDLRKGLVLRRFGKSPSVLPTNHESVMESGESPELSRSGIQIQVPTQPIVRKKGEGGEEAKLGARILVLS